MSTDDNEEMRATRRDVNKAAGGAIFVPLSHQDQSWRDKVKSWFGQDSDKAGTGENVYLKVNDELITKDTKTLHLQGYGVGEAIEKNEHADEGVAIVTLDVDDEDISPRSVDADELSSIQIANHDVADIGAEVNDRMALLFDSHGYGDTGGRLVLQSPYNHVLSTEIDLTDGVVLDGGSMRNEVLADSTYTGRSMIAYENTDSADAFFPEIQHLRVDGNRQNGAQTMGLYAAHGATNASNDAHFDHFFARDTYGEGMRLESSWGYRADNILVEGCGHYDSGTSTDHPGLYVGGRQCHWDKVFVAYCQSDAAVYVADNGKKQFHDFWVWENDKVGIDVQGADSQYYGLDLYANGQAASGSYSQMDISGVRTVIDGFHINGGNQSQFGLRLFSSNNVIANGQMLNHTAYDINCLGTNNVFGNIVCGGTVRIGGVQDNVFHNVVANSWNDNGTRTVINGRSYQSAVPGSATTGDEWGGNEARAANLDVTVVDTSSTQPHAMYKADGNGQWSQIA